MDTFFFVSIAHAAGGSIENATPLTTILLNALRFLLSTIGIVGIIGMVIAGIWYLTAGGDEQKMRVAKQIASACIVGIVIALGALVVVSQIGNWFS